MVDLSVIIPVYNSGILIGRCLDSIFNQSNKYTIEVIIIDDGSDDNSVEIIKKRKENNIIIESQKNQGPAAARNKGINIANGKYIAFLDADDYWLPGFVDKTLDYLESESDIIAVSVGQLHRIIGKDDMILPGFIKNIENKEPFIIRHFFSFWGKNNHICTGSAVIKSEIIKKTGGQRVNLRITEDLEFWAYIATFGNWGMIPEILFVSDGGLVTKSIGWLEKNMKRWNSAPTVEEWQERIIKRIKDSDKEDFKLALGMISQNLCYSIMLSGRKELSYQQTKKYSKFFPKNKISILLKIAVINRLLWIIITNVLIYREKHRKI